MLLSSMRATPPSPRMITLRYLVAFALVTAVAWSHPTPSEAAGTKIWDTKLQETRSLLRSGNFQASFDESQKLLDDLTWKVTGGEGAQRLVGQALALRAVANLGLGNENAALWDWDLARAIYPSFQRGNLPSLGASGSALKALLDATEEATPRARLAWVDVAQLPGHQYQDEALAKAEARQASGETIDPATVIDTDKLIRLSLVDPQRRESCQQITPAKLTARRELELPEGLKELLSSGRYNVMLTVHINDGGLPTSIAVEHEAQLPTAVYAASEYVRSFRFEPTLCDSTPVDVYLRLAIGMSFADPANSANAAPDPS